MLNTVESSLRYSVEGMEMSALKKINKRLPPRLSYNIRKAIGHYSVKKYSTYDEYSSARERGASSSGRVKRWEIEFAKECLSDGKPERLLESSCDFDSSVWRDAGFRRDYFVALISVGRLHEAKSYFRDTLVSGAYTKNSMLRMLGELYLLDDEELVCACARVLLSLDGGLDVRQRVFVQNVVLNCSGEASVIELGGLARQSRGFDVHAFLSNIYRSRNDYLGQVKELSAAFQHNGLSAVVLIDGDHPVSVTNISAVANSASVDGPLVSVAMSTYNASSTIISVLKSLTAQTYRNFEVLVIDDCSSDETVRIAQEYSQSIDPRVRVLEMSENGGTYRIRNRALDEARGVFFTCNDSDDWAHPRKLELLIQPLIESPGAVASMGKLLRISPEIGIKPRLRGYMQDDQSSLCFLRKTVVERMGQYEDVRFGADSEYSERLKATFGTEALKKLDRPLLLAHWSKSSLTGSLNTGITDGGTMAPVRIRYRNEYRLRHRNLEFSSE